MTRSIWKYQIRLDDTQEVVMPRGAELLSVQMQSGDFYIWALCDPGEEVEHRPIYVFGTGHPVEVESITHIDTVMQGPYVWHFFEGGRA